MAKQSFYFQHDSNARNDDRIIAVRMRHKMEGYGIYFAILERLLESSSYMSVTDYNIIAFDLHVSSELVKSIVEDFGLFQFTEDRKFFYSEKFNKRMEPLDNIREQRRIAGQKSAEKRANQRPLDEKSTTVQRPLDKSSTEEIIVDKNKEKPTNVGKKKNEQAGKLTAAKAATLTRKKTFYDSLVPFIERYDKGMIRAFFDYWSEMNKSETKMRFELLPTWEVSKRLATWANREKVSNKPKVDKYEQKRIDTEQRKLDSVSRIQQLDQEWANSDKRKELEASLALLEIPPEE